MNAQFGLYLLTDAKVMRKSLLPTHRRSAIKMPILLLMRWSVIFVISFVAGLWSGCSRPQSGETKTMPKQEISNPFIVLKTNQGSIELELFTDIAPKAVENFLGLVRQGYYDGTFFHRVIKNFMIQGGDPTGTGRGGTSIWKAPFEDEVHPHVTFDRAGILAMANAGPNTNGSQFFITTVPTPHLHMKHTIFGEVKNGFEVVQKIENSPTGPRDRPQELQVIEKAYVKQE